MAGKICVTSVIAPAIIATLWCNGSMGLSQHGCHQGRWERTPDCVPKYVGLMKQFRPRFGRSAQTVPAHGFLRHSRGCRKTGAGYLATGRWAESTCPPIECFTQGRFLVHLTRHGFPEHSWSKRRAHETTWVDVTDASQKNLVKSERASASPEMTCGHPFG